LAAGKRPVKASTAADPTAPLLRGTGTAADG